jgi:hypothetical protein
VTKPKAKPPKVIVPDAPKPTPNERGHVLPTSDARVKDGEMLSVSIGVCPACGNPKSGICAACGNP